MAAVVSYRTWTAAMWALKYRVTAKPALSAACAVSSSITGTKMLRNTMTPTPRSGCASAPKAQHKSGWTSTIFAVGGEINDESGNRGSAHHVRPVMGPGVHPARPHGPGEHIGRKPEGASVAAVEIGRSGEGPG